MLTLLDINTPIATWVLARLFDEEMPIPRKNLLKKLCQASFDSMNADNDFADTMKKLEAEEYIEYSKADAPEFLPVQEHNVVSYLPSETKLQKVTKTHKGYVITEAGIIAFRRQIATPLEKIRRYADKLSSSHISKFEQLINELKSKSGSIISFAIKKCIDDAPYILKFIDSSKRELYKLGISLLE